jgi:hypothetical protein
MISPDPAIFLKAYFTHLVSEKQKEKRRSKMPTPETILKNEVVAFLKTSGMFWMRLNAGKVRVRGGFLQLAPEGCTDILIFPPKRIVWAEIKPPGQSTAKNRKTKQAEFRDKVLAEGHEHVVVTSLLDLQLALSLKIV